MVIALYYLLFAGGLLLVIRALGYRPRYRDIFKLSFAANLGKYLPGGVWQVAGKVAMARQAGVDRHAALVATIVESAVSVTGGLLLFLTTTLLGAPFPVGVPKWPLYALMVAIFVALQPQIFARVVAFGMQLLKVEGEPPHLKFRQIVALVAYYAAIWVVGRGGLLALHALADPGSRGGGARVRGLLRRRRGRRPARAVRAGRPRRARGLPRDPDGRRRLRWCSNGVDRGVRRARLVHGDGARDVGRRRGDAVLGRRGRGGRGDRRRRLRREASDAGDAS